jgi:superfamily II DNA or RNA helicase/HKD family nuclease
MSEKPSGIYEVLITEALSDHLGELGQRWHVVRDALRPPEAADRIAFHLGQIIEKAVQGVEATERSQKGVALARDIVDLIKNFTGQPQLGSERPTFPPGVLRAVQGYRPDGAPAEIGAPLTPLLDTTLLTNAHAEPRLTNQVQSEIVSADGIHIVMAFVRRSGIRPLLGDLRRHCESGRALRLLTTTYTGSTEAEALDELARIGARVKVSYDNSGTRLHAKAWLFHRASGFSTAFIGSSNLTQQAQVTGLEWNVRVSGARNPDVLRQMEAIFESYWNGQDFKDYDPVEFRERVDTSRPGGITITLAPTEIRAEPFQARMLEQIALARRNGHHRNLLVSATGTGKTVMAALDYVALRAQLPRARLLFVAHREEILTRSRDTFRVALRDTTFGEEWVSGRRPAHFEHVFASIQSLATADLAHLEPDHFDVVIVDEFHHAAAQSYQKVLGYLRPRELLGLTATPERSDGLSVLEWFDGRIAAELRLWDAIDQQRLAPFQYYGIHDGLDLTGIPWKRGRGYDVGALTNLITRDHFVARLVIKQLIEHVSSVTGMRALGFCVSVEHARFLADEFLKAGIPAVAIWSDTAEAERRGALKDLANGKVKVVFSVDLFNEGIDVPTVDTLLMLRPTESGTLFLQQLGRGLRKSQGKTICTVLDFVGQHRREFKYDQRFRALLGGTRKQVITQIESGFPFLPAGCHMELDRIASEIVLASVRNAVPSIWRDKIAALQQMVASGATHILATYLEESGLELDDIYANNRSWSDLLEAAGYQAHPSGPQEKSLRRAAGRLLHVDDPERINTWREFISADQLPAVAGMSVRKLRLIRMLVVAMVESAPGVGETLEEGVALLWQHPQVLLELSQLLDVLATQVTHLPIALTTHADVPLQVHAQYTRLEILIAFGLGEGIKTPPWREGVYWAADAKADLFVFTVDKSSGNFSPTTRYRDYAISPSLIHWESQSNTKTKSEVGQRYQHHVARGSSVMLFARKTTDDRAFFFLGPATYVKHESEAPMAITWRMQAALPGDIYAEFAAAAG